MGVLLIVSVLQEKEIYRWPIRESLKSLLAMGWSIDRAKDGESMSLQRENEKMRKISQTSQVKQMEPIMGSNAAEAEVMCVSHCKCTCFEHLQANGFNPSPIDISNVVLSRELQVSDPTFAFFFLLALSENTR